MSESLSMYQPLAEIVILLLGLIVGSFLNVCIYRLPRGLSVVRPRSHCPSCKALVQWFDNVPIVSYLFLKGRCRYCSATISFRYPLIELLSAVLSWLVYRRFGIGVGYLFYFPFAASLLTVSAIDLDHGIIPDEISIPGIAIGLIFAGFWPYLSLWDSLVGILAGGGFLYLVGFFYGAATKREGIGGGDIKLMAMIGAFLGWKGSLFTIFAGSLIASLTGVSIMILRKADGKMPIPFGPFLSGAALLYLLAGDRIIWWYFSLLQP